MTSTQATPELSYLEHRMAMYRSQVALRRFEQRGLRPLSRELREGTSHLSIGQEAIAAGVRRDAPTTDVPTYRGHAHTLARGVPMTPVFAEN